MDRARFKDACAKVVNAEREQNGIGTLGEKTLHAVLKLYFEPDKSFHEIKIGSYYADIVTEEGIIEIQTRAYYQIRNKLAALLATHPVTVVCPIPKTKWISWIDEQTGETTKKRKSPKQGKINDAMPELYWIKRLLAHPNFRLCIALIDIKEYRYLNGWGKDKKRGASRCDRVPVEIAEEVYFNEINDYYKFVPNGLKSQFTSKDFMGASNTTLRNSQTALNVLNHIGIVRRVAKQGNLHVYERACQ
jgi:hypothetical protein